MVGRALPNLRPNGEDHRGAGGGKQMGMLRTTARGTLTHGFRSWGRRVRIRIHRVLGCLYGAASGLSAILLILPVRTWAIDRAGLIVAGFTAIQMRKTMQIQERAKVRRATTRTAAMALNTSAMKKEMMIRTGTWLVWGQMSERKYCFDRHCTS